MSGDLPQRPMDRLLAIMARLRDPDTGCPWDVEQTFATIAPYTLEEAYEVADAIARDDMDDLRDELGDLLFQVVFHARMAEDSPDPARRFTFDEVAAGSCAKMERRHPHVFSQAEIADAEAQTQAWEEHKAAERAAKATGEPSALDGVALALPALLRALKLQRRAARVGFDWPDWRPVVDKLHEELGELAEELDVETPNPDRLLDEMGDLLFVCVNLARKLDLDPEAALRHANDKFSRRFKGVEARLRACGQTPETATLEDMEAHWQAVKAAARAAGNSSSGD
ncbi:nucleoside triphosphate pyrophosphohydrolase [Roseospirillum parvum]|uniref:Nucleoside triphosphate pyrophosphohydrolase n=1 Tax=Roseospirillum parvum TaxID=83401 RepID=A0A1G7Y8U4_9PROT|nr:nucleoside triphosphate pyrophosphohydrolase [Roseospirillum parvum]SDG92872.1 ATP diphosphatase [Roseospirillum parvum]